MARRPRAVAGVAAATIVAGAVVGTAIAGPMPLSVAAPERDSSFGTSDASDGDRVGRGFGSADGVEGAVAGRTAAERRPFDDVPSGDALVEEPSWRWVLYQDLATGAVRKYRIGADGLTTETLPEESVAVDFLTAYLDTTMPLRERSARIRPFLAANSAQFALRDPFFRHPPASSVTGEATSAAAAVETDPSDAAVRVVFVGTDIGDYRVTVSPVAVARDTDGDTHGGEVENRTATRWEVHSVLPPATWLRPAVPRLVR